MVLNGANTTKMKQKNDVRQLRQLRFSNGNDSSENEPIDERVSSVSRVSCNFLYYRHGMPGNGQKKKRGTKVPRTGRRKKRLP